MSDRQHILDSIWAIARGLGHPLTRSEFVALAKISEYFVTQCFPSWNDAVRSAGLHANALNVRLEDGELLKDWGEIIRANHAIPAKRAYRRVGKYDPRTLERRFGPWSSLPQVFLNFAKDHPEWADVAALFPVPVLKQEHASNHDSTSPMLPKKTQHVPFKRSCYLWQSHSLPRAAPRTGQRAGRRTSLWDARRRTRPTWSNRFRRGSPTARRCGK
jgi:Homing endonuclease associated repeat